MGLSGASYIGWIRVQCLCTVVPRTGASPECRACDRGWIWMWVG